MEDYGVTGGLYRGTYIVGPNENYDTFWYKKGYSEGDEVEMNEVCSHDEFITMDRVTKFTIGDEVIIVKCDNVVRENHYVGREGSIHRCQSKPNGYVIIFDDKEKFFWESELIINREKRLAKLLDK